MLLVIGDLMIDRFVWGEVTRISPEAPVPIVRQSRESSCLGGAGNVARNLAALGAHPVPIGLRGDDRDGELLEEMLRDGGLSTDGIVPVAARPTTVKTRIIARHQQVVRVDRESDDPPLPAIDRELERRTRLLLDRAQALIVSDYDKGAISRGLLEAILPEAARRNLPVVIDPKVRLFQYYRPATVVTPNAREAMEAAGHPARSSEDFEAVGRRLLEMLGSPYLLLTLGERGMLLQRRGGPSLTIPAAAREVFDVTGAGDTVVATLALALVAGATMEEAAVLANRAAGIVVGKLGTATVSREELLEAVES